MMKRRITALERGSIDRHYPAWLRSWLGYAVSDTERDQADSDMARLAVLPLDPKQVSPEMVAWLAN